nr:hypothetical protein [Anaerolineaceae bacterium]
MKKINKLSRWIIASILVLQTVFMASCVLTNVAKTGTDEYNELIALVEGVQSSASNFQLVTDTQYAKIQAKTQITNQYYEAVATSGEVWTGNFRAQEEQLAEMLQNYQDSSGNPIDTSNLNLAELAENGALPDGLGQGFSLYVNAVVQAPPPVPDS